MQHSKMKKYIIILIVLIIPLVSKASTLLIKGSVNNSVTSGLSAYYKLDEAVTNSTVIDSSGNGHNATPTNSPTYIFGKIGPTAMTFTGATNGQEVDLGNIVDFSGTNNYTVSAWVEFGPQTSDYKRAISDESAVNTGFLWTVGPVADPTLYIARVTAGADTNVIPLSNFSTSQWTLLTNTFDGSTLSTYLNGVLFTSQPSTGSAGASTDMRLANIGCGNSCAAGVQHLNGSLDDVRFYNRALSQTEITQLYLYTGVATFQKLLVQIGHTLIVKR